MHFFVRFFCSSLRNNSIWRHLCFISTFPVDASMGKSASCDACKRYGRRPDDQPTCSAHAHLPQSHTSISGLVSWLFIHPVDSNRPVPNRRALPSGHPRQYPGAVCHFPAVIIITRRLRQTNRRDTRVPFSGFVLFCCAPPPLLLYLQVRFQEAPVVGQRRRQRSAPSLSVLWIGCEAFFSGVCRTLKKKTTQKNPKKLAK